MDKKQKDLLNKLVDRANHNIVAIGGNSLCYEIEGITEYNNDIRWGEVVESIMYDSDYQTDVEKMHLFIKINKVLQSAPSLQVRCFFHAKNKKEGAK